MRRRSDVLWRSAPGFLALSREGRDVTVVHGAAADVWHMLETDVEAATVSDILATRYHAPLDVVRSDLEELISQLVHQGYVEVD